MEYYVVNDNAQPTGEHEVHKKTCIYFNKIKSYSELVYFFSCNTAIVEAKKNITMLMVV
jgi:hypothetical protein|tara:strand:+ start:43 stop:219 length:177 start_codon:yes stop_codon:yes gene_type:complete